MPWQLLTIKLYGRTHMAPWSLSVQYCSLDRHGGEHVSKYISEHLHELFESVDPASIPDIIKYTKSHGDYFKRWGGGGLRRWMPDSVEGTPEEGSGMTFEERLVLAFLTVSLRSFSSCP